jgi:hypothetical protein
VVVAAPVEVLLLYPLEDVTVGRSTTTVEMLVMRPGAVVVDETEVVAGVEVGDGLVEDVLVVCRVSYQHLSHSTVPCHSDLFLCGPGAYCGFLTRCNGTQGGHLRAFHNCETKTAVDGWIAEDTGLEVLRI